MRVVADVTKAYQGTARPLIDAALDKFPDAGLSVICKESQCSQLNDLNSKAEIEPLPSETHHRIVVEKVWDQIRENLERLGDSSQLIVLSFHGEVFQLPKRLEPASRSRVNVQRWAEVKSDSAGDFHYDWPKDFMTKEEVIEVLKDALRRVSATSPEESVHKTDVRSLLALTDSRLDKSNPPAATPGLITMIIQAAEKRNVVDLDRTETPSNPSIWLKEKAGAAGNVRSATSNASETSTSKYGADLESSRETTTKSDQIYEALVDDSFGPYSRVREMLYDNLESKINEQSGEITFRELLSETIRSTREQSIKEEVIEGNYPWRGVKGFLVELLRRRPVVLDTDEQEIVPSFKSDLTEVGELKESWNLELEGELILRLLEMGIELDYHDIYGLAGALYLEKNETGVAKASKVVDHLLQANRVKEKGTQIKLSESESEEDQSAES